MRRATPLPEASWRRLLRRLAETGEPRAQFEYGCLLPRGPERTAWRRRAARALPEAQERVAWGLRAAPHPLPAGIERDARRLERSAARAGRPGALRTVAWWWLRPPRTPARTRHAVRWLERAVRAGEGYAARDLALTVETLAGDLRKVRRLLARAVLLDEDDTDCLFPLLLIDRATPWLRRFRTAPREAWERRATAGDVEAQTCLGYAQRFGRGVPYDPPRAQRTLESAARRGSREAATALGLMAWDVEADVPLEAAAGWFARAARGGDPEALWGAANLHGFGKRPDSRRAFGWALAAARQGHVRAAYAAAVAYACGDGVRTDRSKAARWMRVAAEGGLPEAQVWYAEILGEGYGVRRRAREATACLRRAARRGNSDAMLKLGVRLHEGRGARRDDREAVRWYRAAAARGNEHAMHNLALCFKHGDGVRRHVPTALRWFRRALLAGDHPGSAWQLGSAYADGWAGRRDPGLAARWWTHGAALADAECLRSLSRAYAAGAGVARDPVLARRLASAARRVAPSGGRPGPKPVVG